MAYGSVKMCLQCATCSMVSTCLFRALKFLSCRDSRVKEEACRWPQGIHRHRHGEGLPEAPPGHPRGCDHSL